MLKPEGFITSHVDPEKIYRYHLCLQVEPNLSKINDTILNVGEDHIIDTEKTHSAKNQSDSVERIHLVVDFATSFLQVKNYVKIFGYGNEWEEGCKKNAK